MQFHPAGAAGLGAKAGAQIGGWRQALDRPRPVRQLHLGGQARSAEGVCAARLHAPWSAGPRPGWGTPTKKVVCPVAAPEGDEVISAPPPPHTQAPAGRLEIHAETHTPLEQPIGPPLAGTLNGGEGQPGAAPKRRDAPVDIAAQAWTVWGTLAPRRSTMFHADDQKKGAWTPDEV